MLKMKLLVRLVELGVLFSSFLLQAQNRLKPFNPSLFLVVLPQPLVSSPGRCAVTGNHNVLHTRPKEDRLQPNMPPVAKLQPAESNEAFGKETRKEHDSFRTALRL